MFHLFVCLKVLVFKVASSSKILHRSYYHHAHLKTPTHMVLSMLPLPSGWGNLSNQTPLSPRGSIITITFHSVTGLIIAEDFPNDSSWSVKPSKLHILQGLSLLLQFG
jgi:hypothetical protein